MPLNLEKIDLGSFGVNEDQQEGRLNANMSEAIKIDPVQQTKANDLSKQSGVPEFAIQSNPEEIEHKLKLDQIDLEGMTERAPVTAKFLSKDFNNAVIAQEDVGAGVLESIENIFSGLGESISVGFKQQMAGAVLSTVDSSTDRRDNIVPWTAMPMGMEFEAQQMSLELAERMGVKSDEEYVALKQRGANELIKHIQLLDERRQEITPGNLNIVEEGVRSGIESLANMVPATLAMVGTQGRALPLFLIGTQTYLGSYADARGEGLDADTSNWFAGIDAAIEVGTEVLPLGVLENMMTGASKGLKKDLIKFAVREMGSEQLATALQSLNSYMFGLDEQMNNATSVEERVEIQLRRQAVTVIATAVTGGLQAGGVSIVNKTVEKLTQSETQLQTKNNIEQRAIDQLDEQAGQSELKKLDVETFKQFVREADGDKDTHVFINNEQAFQYLQNKTRDEIESDPVLKMIDNKLRDERNTGSDISIPVDDFMGDIAGTEHFKQLRDHMTVSNESVSASELEQHQAETQNYIRTMLNEAEENISEYAEAQDIFTQVQSQLTDTGAVNSKNSSIMAQVVPAWATAFARREGIGVADAYRESGLVVEGPQTGELNRLQAEEILIQSPVNPTQDFGDIELAQDVQVASTGDTTKVTRSAQKQFDQTMKRRNVVAKVVGCLNGA